MRIPIIRKGEYDIWSMRMRQYICHTDHNLWDVIVNSDLKEEPAPTGETSAPPAPRTAKQLFHNVADAKSLWEEIKSRFGGNEKSKKMQKNVQKYQFEIFSTASNESLDKAYDSTNEVSTASRDFRVSTAGGISQVSSTSCAHDVACSFFAQPTTSPQLENEDFQQIDEDDLEELDLRWQVDMLTVRCYNYHRKRYFAREYKSRRNQGRRSYGDNGRSNTPTNESSSQALVAQDGLGGYDWSNDFEIEPINVALMPISSQAHQAY
ncbi:hypothetical protein Tco_0888024 [Tanacetum coccineum]